jgi:ABC-type cobalamin/Fe3+-siderophores transport system ATPase subunit
LHTNNKDNIYKTLESTHKDRKMLIIVRTHNYMHYYFISGSSFMKNSENVFYATPIDHNVFEINVDNLFECYIKKKKKPLIYNAVGKIRIVHNLCVRTILYER